MPEKVAMTGVSGPVEQAWKIRDARQVAYYPPAYAETPPPVHTAAPRVALQASRVRD